MKHPSPDSPKSPPEGAVDASLKRARSPLWSKPWLWLGVGLAGVALAYGVGRLQGALALRSAQQQHAAAIEQVRSTLGACEIDRSLLTVRRSLALVALSLDRRNFGVAESHRREAAQTLEQPTLSGLAEVSKLSSTIRALNLGVDPDPGAKREQVIAASEALDRLLAARAPAVAPAPAASATTLSP